jgi:hypothetical protein
MAGEPIRTQAQTDLEDSIWSGYQEEKVTGAMTHRRRAAMESADARQSMT